MATEESMHSAVTSTAEQGNSESLTVPASPRSLTFLFFSDTQPDPESEDYTGIGELLKQAVTRDEKPELVIFGGDTVNDGGDEDQWRGFRDAIGSSLDGVITAAVSGNHDNYALLAEQFDYPSETQKKPGEGFFYTFTAGPVFFIMLDSNIMGAANQQDVEWLQNVLQSEDAQKAGWRIAVMHHPMWPVTDNPKDIKRAETMRERFLPVLEANNVEMILCGHQHVYTRTRPMRGDSADDNTTTDSGSGIVQIMAASGDKASYTVGERDFIMASSIAPNYLLLIADSESLTVTAYNEEHIAIDSLEINGSSNHSDSSDSVNSTWRIKVINTEGTELWSFTEFELTRLQQERAGAFAHVYSTINNWPTTRFYAADGYRVENILRVGNRFWQEKQ